MNNIKIIVKYILLLSYFFGAYCFFIFSIYEQIPFPIDMSILPAIILALGLLSILFTLIITSYVLISGFVLFDPLEINYSKLFYEKPTQNISEKIAGFINFFLFFCLLPIFIFTTSLYNHKYLFEIHMLSLFLIPMLFSYYILTPNKKVLIEKGACLKTLKYWKTAFTYFCIGFLSLASSLIFIKYMKFGLHIDSNFEYAFSFLVFIFLNYFILLPLKQKDNFQVNAQKYSNKKFLTEIRQTPAFFVYLIVGIIALIPSVSTSTTAAAFKILNIGGGIERVYYYSKLSRIVIPPELREICIEDYCKTKKLKIIFDFGGILYIKTNELGFKNTVVSLPRKHLYLIQHQHEKNAKGSGDGSGIR